MAQNNPVQEMELAMASLLIRTPSIVSRPAGKIINSEEMLTTRELSMFIDLARLETQVEHRDAELVPELPDWRRFWRMVFRRWNTTHPDNENPQVVGDVSTETSVKVGTLVCDHPPNKAYPGPQPRWRSEGADVFLGVLVPQWQSWLEFVWRDSKGKPVKPSLVKLDMNIYEWFDLAISRYDRCVQDRIEKYNEDCIIATARRRLVNFAKRGTGHEPNIKPGDEAPLLMPIELAGDRAERMSDIFANLKRLRDQRVN